eukprot:gene3583-4463_t
MIRYVVTFSLYLWTDVEQFDEGSGSEKSGPLCIFLGVWGQFWGQATVMWSFMMSVKVFHSFFYATHSRDQSAAESGSSLKYYHLFVWSFCGINAAIIGAFNQYGPCSTGCWISGNKNLFRLFELVPLYFTITFSIVILVVILLKMNHNRPTLLPTESQRYKAQERDFRNQLLKFIFVFILFWIVPTILRTLEYFDLEKPPLVLLDAASISLQALGNSIVWATSPQFFKLLKRKVKPSSSPYGKNCTRCNITSLNPNFEYLFPLTLKNLYLKNNKIQGIVTLLSLSGFEEVDLTVDSEDLIGDFQFLGERDYGPVYSTPRKIVFKNIGLKILPNPYQFPKLSMINLSNNQLRGELPLESNNISFILDNNFYYGSIPESYCLTESSFANNLFNGTVPSCYLCYLDDTRDIIKGNNFLNYRDDDPPKPCDIQIDSISPIIYSFGATITGKNFGFGFSPISRWPTSNPPFIQWAYTTSNRIIHAIGLSNSTYEAVKENGYVTNITFTTSYGPITKRIQFPLPIPEIREVNVGRTVSNQGFTFFIIGIAFSTVVNQNLIKMGPYECIPSYLGSNYLTCTVYQLGIPEDTYNVTVSVNGVLSAPFPFRYKRSDSFYINAVAPPYTTGGTVSIFGKFGIDHTNTTVTIGNRDCPISFVNESMIFCTIGPGSGRSELAVSLNGFPLISDFVYYEEYPQCSNPCINGYCLNGACFCKSGFGGSKCDMPTTNSTINNNGNSTVIDLDNVKFGFSIYSIQELFFNKTINRELVFEKWNLTFSNKTHWVYSYNFETSTISYTIEEVEQDRNISFAGVDMNLTKGSLKLWVTIKEWRYLGSLNHLRLVLVSNATSTNKCSKSTNIQTYESDYSLNYITLEKDGKTLYGRFIDRALSDGRITFSETRVLKQSEDSIIVGISLPNCKLCELDPNYSMLISGNQDKCSETNNKWVLPTAIVISVFGFISLSIIGVSMVRRYFYISFSRESGLFIMLKSKAASRSSGSDDKSIPLKINK